MITFKQFLKDNLRETPLPNDWDATIFTKKVSFEKQIDYALERATKIGAGSSRVAFEIEYKGRPTILKIAKNEKGLAQNKDEIEILKNSKSKFFDIIIPMLDYDKENQSEPRWIHVEKAEHIKESKLCDLLKVPNLKTLYKAASKKFNKDDRDMNIEFIELFNDESPNDFKIAMAYVDILSRLETEYDINLVDFSKFQNWGIYHNRPVLIDLGYTKYVSDTFYKKK